jgi:phage/plasmid-like protein (TIGR03299 family)
MFSGNRQVPWHGQGQVIEGLATAAEAIQHAHLDWQVEKRPLTVKGQDIELRDYKAVVRCDNNFPLGVVKNRYTVIQNADAFGFFDEVVGAGQAIYETAGALHDGRKIWIMAKLPNTVYVDSTDKHEQWVLLVTAHDGSHGVWMQHVAVRVVCQNTLTAALDGATNQIKIRHTKNYKSKKEEAQRVLGIAEAYFTKLGEVMNMLKTKKMTVDDAVKFNEVLFPASVNEETGEVEVSTRTENVREEVISLFQRGTGNVGESRYDYLNAITEFTDFSRSIRVTGDKEKGESRFDSILLGSGARLKQQAIDLLVA